MLGGGYAVAVRGGGFLRAGPLDHGAGADLVERGRRARAGRDPDRALLPHRQFRALDPVRLHRARCSPRCFRLATEQLGKRDPRPGLATAGALFATGAVAAWRWRSRSRWRRAGSPSALALMVPGIAWIAEKRPLPMLRWLAAALVVLVIVRIGWEPRIVGDDVGTTPIFNWLLYGYGIPAVAFWFAGYLLRRRADDHPARMVDIGGDPVHGPARGARNTSLHEQRRRLQRQRHIVRDRAAGVRLPRDGDRARACARAHRQHRAQYRRAIDRRRWRCC